MDSRSEKIIVALDVGTAKEALRLVEQLGSSTSHFKVGLQLFINAGPSFVRQLVDQHLKIFLDLKLHDIPNTVANAVRACRDLGVEMTTIHLAGGRDMIAAAFSARNSGLTLLGVTVLTSMDSTTLRGTGVSDDPSEQVLRLATLGSDLGINGFVASPHELQSLRARFGDEVTIVVPGIRPSSAAASDQRRIMTPAEAIKLGADYLVIGRPITAHPQPAEALRQIVAEIDQTNGGL
jgi:orotidine-5'-phosphate decarboxylase